MKASATLEEAIERFWAKVDRSEECWLWTASKNARGYGNFRSNTFFKGELLAHRVSFRIRHGRAPKGDLLHACDNPGCVRPDHLREGTHAENMAEMAARGRAASHKGAKHLPRGAAHHFHLVGAKISREQARTIRASSEPNKVLADLFGVDRSMISKIKNGRHWAE